MGSHVTAPGEELWVRCLAQGHLSRGIEGGESAGYSLPHQQSSSIPAGPEIWTHNLWITSPTLLTLGHDTYLNNVVIVVTWVTLNLFIYSFIHSFIYIWYGLDQVILAYILICRTIFNVPLWPKMYRQHKLTSQSFICVCLLVATVDKGCSGMFCGNPPDFLCLCLSDNL